MPGPYARLVGPARLVLSAMLVPCCFVLAPGPAAGETSSDPLPRGLSYVYGDRRLPRLTLTQKLTGARGVFTFRVYEDTVGLQESFVVDPKGVPWRVGDSHFPWTGLVRERFRGRPAVHFSGIQRGQPVEYREELHVYDDGRELKYQREFYTIEHDERKAARKSVPSWRSGALRLAPYSSDADLKRERARALLVMAQAIARRDVPAAIAACDEAHRLAPEVTEVTDALMYFHLEQGDTARAAAVALEQVDACPQDARAHFSYGAVLALRAGRGDEAIHEFDAAIRLDPKLTAGYVGGGNPALAAGALLWRAGQRERALNYIERWAAAQPQDRRAREALEYFRRELARSTK